MAKNLINKIAEFACDIQFKDLPDEVVQESKRVILDSIGCTLGGATHDKGKIGLQFARQMGGCPEATVIGYGDKLSAMSASFANGELMNALDFDAVLPPGHVVPYTIPVALATGELQGSSGEDLILATALSHEISYRFGKAMDYLRDVKNGKMNIPEVFGFSATIFGATAAIGKLKKYNSEVMSNALAIAGYTSPVNTERPWIEHSPVTTTKYQHAGWACMGALVSAGMAELGHRGDISILEDDGVGWPKMIGTKKWEPEVITEELGEKWLFPAFQSYKHYPHCRVLAAPLDALIYLVEEYNIKPEEIESIKAWVEDFCMRPMWLNTNIEHITDGQFSMAHALSVAAHRMPPGPAWQDASTVWNPSILAMMDKVTFDVHPDYVQSITKNPASRHTRIEIKARGQVFTEERLYPKGSPSPEPETYTTTNELVAKFKVNAERILPVNKIEPAVNALLGLEDMADIRELMRLVSL
jgi:2-methylcitrate dehydratase PrpD